MKYEETESIKMWYYQAGKAYILGLLPKNELESVPVIDGYMSFLTFGHVDIRLA